MKQYTCPMHPEIIKNEPGRCPKCGMALVEKGSTPKIVSGGTSYTPLIVVIAMILASAIIVSYRAQDFSANYFILNFMTGFFLVFGAFKLMDLKGFAEGYSTYDLLASRVFFYGYLYPFIELTFGFSMLAGFHPDWLLWTEFIVMAFSGIGVAIKIARGEPFFCACLGTFLKVPLTKITLIEDFGMAILALFLIL